MMKIAAMLLRVSTEQQDMESQKKELESIINTEGFYVPDHYIFGQKITGRDNVRTADRESISSLKEACKSGEIKAIFVCEVSRLSRSPIAGRLFIDEFTELKVPIYFKDVNSWTIDKDTFQPTPAVPYINMMFDMAANELKTFKSRSLRGRKQSARQGKVTGGILKFGYSKDITTGKYVLIESEANFIKDIYAKYITGEYSIRRLTHYANSLQIPTAYNKKAKEFYTTKGGVQKSTSSAKWTTQTIKDILSNEIYIGKRSFTDIIQETPPIIDQSVFIMAQKRLKENPHTIDKSKHVHILQKVMVCGNCGNIYYGSYKKRSNAYLCSAFTRTAMNCNNTTLNYERAESIIWDFLKKHTYFFNRIKEEEKESLVSKYNKLKLEKIDSIGKFKRLIHDEDIKLQNLIEAVTSKVFSFEEISSKRSQIDRLKNEYQSECMVLENELVGIDNKINHILSNNLTDEALLRIESNRQLMREKVKEIIDRIVVYKLENRIALMQVHYLDKVYNLMYQYRKTNDRYYYIDDSIATFNKSKSVKDVITSVSMNISIPDFSVTSSNNSCFDDEVFGDYSGVELLNILEKYGCYSDYIKFERIITSPKYVS